ncbi:hypothetical protein C5S31_08220 [ANME-1 cluster archaeon GoMg2]|nr:hypothetical protein [ANME-1 cluster archaeon GoMg2]
MYGDIVDHKPPGIEWYILSVFKIFGYNLFAVRFISIVAFVIAAIAIYMIGKELFNQQVGLLSLFFFCIEPLIFVIKPYELCQTLWVVYFWLPSFYLFIKGVKANKGVFILISGFLVGLSVIMKQVGIFLLLVFIVYLVMGLNMKNIFSKARLLFLTLFGFSIPIVLMIYYFWINNALNDFWIYVFEVNQLHLFIDFPKKIIYVFNFYLGRTILFIASGVLLVWFLNFNFNKQRSVDNDNLVKINIKRVLFDKSIIVLFVWFGINLLFVFLPKPLYEHYLIPTIPSFCLLCGLVVSKICNGVIFGYDGCYLNNTVTSYRNKNNKRGDKFVLMVMLILLISSVPFFSGEAGRLIKGYPYVSITEENEIGQYIKSITNQSDKIMVFTNPIFYFRSERDPATKYSYYTWIWEESIIKGEFNNAILNGLRAEDTKVVLLSSVYEKEIPKEFMDVIKEEYKPIKSFEYRYHNGITIYVKR